MSTILIADDDLVTRKMLKSTLERIGHKVIDAADGDEAWELLQRSDSPQLVILDWMMPGKDGPEIVTQLRALEKEKYHYIMLLTSKSEKEDITHGWESGADDFITKPFDRDELTLRLHAGERIITLENNLASKNKELEGAYEKISFSNARMRDELQAAAKTQAALLPSEHYQDARVDFKWAYEPCEELAGDILNFFKLDENNIGMYVLDVSGHGVASALLSVTVNRFLTPQQRQSTILSKYNESDRTYDIVSPANVLKTLNKHFPMDIRTGQYFTIVYGVLNTKTLQFRFSSAGHPPIILSDAANGTREISCPGLPIGFDEEADYNEIILDLTSGNRLYFYSDGINEAKNGKKVEFGVANLVDTVATLKNCDLRASLDKLISAVRDWNHDTVFDDDITILSLEIK
ncbi:SpoIIE family protein phosphatase [candidate division KSB1 bacterium]|nr:SpoIIE family protein phosphatase [candidate division KSB1 bacterium]